MQSNDKINSALHGDMFAIATFILARLRRVTGRVIDVMYLIENKQYAYYVVDLLLNISDTELKQHALRLRQILEHDQEFELTEEIESVEATSNDAHSLEHSALKMDESSSEPLHQDEYAAQISHHYIGALR